MVAGRDCSYAAAEVPLPFMISPLRMLVGEAVADVRSSVICFARVFGVVLVRLGFPSNI